MFRHGDKWLGVGIKPRKAQLSQAEAKEAIYKAVMEVIGEDLQVLPHFSRSVKEARISINQYKAEQRQRANQLFGKGENN